MSSYVIGLTGGIACGKSNLSRALRLYGAPVVDADEISRALTAPGGTALPAIRAAFGNQVFDGDELNRRALSDVIFSSPEARKRLNDILHPLIFSEMRRQMDSHEGPVVLDVPLLFETGMEDWCDEIWCAYVTQKEQIRRLRKREGLTVRQALMRIHSQMPTMEKRRKADHVIRTEGTKQESAEKALALWREALSREPHTRRQAP